MVAELQTFFFRESERALFGCFHPPKTTPARATVVVCQPHHHEYVRAHRAVRQLSEHLAHAGYAVLRFDFYGNGDSDGTSEDGSLGQWLADVPAAIEEGRARSGSPRVCLIGVRLGATVACLTAAREHSAQALVMWDPIVRGADYLKELATGEQDRRRAVPSWARASSQNGEHVEYIGFAYSPRLLQEIRAVDLADTDPRVERTLLVRTEVSGNGGGPSERWLERLPRLQQRTVSTPRMWATDAEGLVLAPPVLLDVIQTWLREAMP